MVRHLFEIERKTWQAVCDCSDRISQISAERIAIEVEGILTSEDRSRGVELLVESGLLKGVFNGFSGIDVKFSIEVLRHLQKAIDFPLVLAALFAGCKTKFAIEQCKTLKLSNAHKKHLRFLLSNREVLINTDIGLAELKLLVSEPYFEDLYELQRALQKAKGESVKALNALGRRVKALKGKQLRPKPLLDGHELIKLGARPGPMVGLLSREMYVAQLSEELHTASQAKKWVKNWLERHGDL